MVRRTLSCKYSTHSRSLQKTFTNPPVTLPNQDTNYCSIHKNSTVHLLSRCSCCSITRHCTLGRTWRCVWATIITNQHVCATMWATYCLAGRRGPSLHSSPLLHKNIGRRCGVAVANFHIQYCNARTAQSALAKAERCSRAACDIRSRLRQGFDRPLTLSGDLPSFDSRHISMNWVQGLKRVDANFACLKCNSGVQTK